MINSALLKVDWYPAIIPSELGTSLRLMSPVSEVRSDGYGEIADWVEACAAAHRGVSD